VQIRTNTIATLGVNGVALSAAGLEERSTLGGVTCKIFEVIVNMLCGAQTSSLNGLPGL